MATVETVTLVGNVKKWQRFSSEGLLLFLICFHDNASIFLEVLSLKTFSDLLSTMPAFHLDILKIIRPFFLSSNDSLRNEYNKRHFWKFVLKSFATQLKLVSVYRQIIRQLIYATLKRVYCMCLIIKINITQAVLSTVLFRC